MRPYDYANKTVLITGASMGIGEAFARELARRGAKLVLVARSEGRLAKLAGELGEGHHVVAADLAAPGASKRVFDAVRAKGLELDVLVNNAGFGLHGPLDAHSMEAQRGQIDLNVTALFELTYLFLPEIERRQGGVLMVASMGAYQATPYMAVYGATKAFVLSFGEALWAEYRGRGVRVLTLSPGATETPFFERAGEGASGGSKKARPEGVVELGLAAFSAGRMSVVHGFGNNAMRFAARFASRKMLANAVADMTRPKGPAVARG